MGIWLKATDNAEDVIGNLFDSEENLQKMGKQAFKLAHPNSTKEICETIF